MSRPIHHSPIYVLGASFNHGVDAVAVAMNATLTSAENLAWSLTQQSE